MTVASRELADALVNVPPVEGYPGFRLKVVLGSAGATNLQASVMVFEPGGRIDDWHLTYDEVLHIVEGRLLIDDGDTTVEVAAGEVGVIAAGSTVTYRSPEGARGLVVVSPPVG